MMKRNEGFTLLELLIVIIVGSIATAAAVTVMILGLRINHRSTEIATQQNTTRILLAVMERAATEGTADTITYGGDGSWFIKSESGVEIMGYQAGNGEIQVGGAAMLKNVGTADLNMNLGNNLLTLSITIENEESEVEAEYTTSIYCRKEIKVVSAANVLSLAPDEGAADISSAYAESNYEEVLTFAVEEETNPASVTEFLSILASQYGSRGQILTGEGETTGEYFSEWYIGSYAENPDWNQDTPWCACFLSWAMERSGSLVETPRFANVDAMWAEFVTEDSWTANAPAAGDIIFFDWDVDQSYDPAHVGAVLAVSDGWVYTIEGNSGGRVAVCRYDLEDPCILGYGQLNWK